jgi:hypothetical protein
MRAVSSVVLFFYVGWLVCFVHCCGIRENRYIQLQENSAGFSANSTSYKKDCFFFAACFVILILRRCVLAKRRHIGRNSSIIVFAAVVGRRHLAVTIYICVLACVPIRSVRRVLPSNELVQMRLDR